MPTSLRESWRRSQSPNERRQAVPYEPAPEAASRASKPGGLKICIGALTLHLELRFFVLAVLTVPLYAVAAFVGNEWGYMLPASLIACLLIGLLLPLLVVMSISCSCTVPPKNAALGEQEIILKAWRLPFFGLLSNLIPSGYLSAALHLNRRAWRGAKKTPAMVPLPVVLQSLAQGVELCMRAPVLTRGQYEVESLELATCFPFAMVWWIRSIKLDSKAAPAGITVLPVLKPLIGNFHSRLSSSSMASGRNVRSMLLQNRSSNLRGLREFTERDSLNQIHWPSSARSGKFLVREFEHESLPDFDVYIDLVQPWTDAQFDLACTTAYSLAHYGYRLGFTPNLKLKPDLNWEPLAEQLEDIPAGLSGEELIAEILARLSPMPAELRNEYRQYEQDAARDAKNYLSDELAGSMRSIISIQPGEKKDTQNGIVLSESQNSTSESARAAVLARVESDLELARI